MKKIIFALLVLSVALIGMSFVSASSDVDDVNVDSDYENLGDSASNNINKHWDFPDPYDPANFHRILPNVIWGPHGPIDICPPSGTNPGPVA
ncbi:hypothetical protein [Methanobrevibacter sp.]|uniref:hypothetical protein n=1 Tax=Methanobrevibacter sp. TaxID=66852 RepID=UPI00388E122E